MDNNTKINEYKNKEESSSNTFSIKPREDSRPSGSGYYQNRNTGTGGPRRYYSNQSNTGGNSTGTTGTFYKKRPFFTRKKFCFICHKAIENKVNHLSLDVLNRFITDRGKIIPFRYTGNCAMHQRIVKRSIKRARMLSLMPFLRKD